MKKRTKIIGMAVLILDLIFTTAAGTPALSADPEPSASDQEITVSAADPETSSSTAAASSPTARSLSAKPTVSELVDPKNVLFISSFSLSYPTVESQIDGIREGLGDDVNIFYEFMDTKTIFNDTYIAKFYDYINYKYSSIGNVDAVIAGDDNALQMVLRYRDGFFRSIPVVFEAVDSESRAVLAESLGIPGIIEPSTIRDNLDLAVRLYPDASRIVAISDGSTTGKVLTSELSAISSRYSGRSIEIMNTSQLDRREIISRTEQLGSGTILLFMTFNQDSTGKTYTNIEALRLIVSHASIPVFTLMWRGEGSLGGIGADFTEIGRKAGQMTQQILNGTDPSRIESVSDTPEIAKFDASVMETYGIRKIEMPNGSVYVNDSSQKRMIAATIASLAAGLVVMFILLAIARRENRRRKDNENLLQKASEVLRTEADIDGLTGLGNRRSLDRELQRSTESGRSFTLFILDLDEFKKINDTLGHPAGDQVLREIGSRLNRMKTREFVPYRYGGDEFSVMEFSGKAEEADSTGQKILDLFREPVHTTAGDVQVGMSIGSACCPSDAAVMADLIHCVDEALYCVKQHGKNAVKSYRNMERT
jgi:diguanylate cyclase (GGDEF)-like protein